MGWRIAGDRINKHFLQLQVGATTNGNMQSTDLGKLVTVSSGQASLFVGTTSAVPARSIAGILAAVPAGGIAASGAGTVTVQPIAPNEIVEADFSTSSTDEGSTAIALVSTNIGYVFRVNGSGNNSGAADAIEGQFFDATTCQTTIAASTVGCLYLQDYSTDRRTAHFVFASSCLAY